MCSLDFQQPQLEEQPFTNYLYSFDYELRGEMVKIAILSYDYERELVGYRGHPEDPCYPICAIRYLVLDECGRFLYSPENLTDEEDDDIQERFCMFYDYNPNEEAIECWF